MYTTIHTERLAACTYKLYMYTYILTYYVTYIYIGMQEIIYCIIFNSILYTLYACKTWQLYIYTAEEHAMQHACARYRCIMHMNACTHMHTCAADDACAAYMCICGDVC